MYTNGLFVVVFFIITTTIFVELRTKANQENQIQYPECIAFNDL